jgi:hypothetical protein
VILTLDNETLGWQFFFAPFTWQFCAGLFVAILRPIIVQSEPGLFYELVIAKLTFQSLQVLRATHTGCCRHKSSYFHIYKAKKSI